MDPNDVDGEGAGKVLQEGASLDGDGAQEARADGKIAGRPPGSLMSLKIRKRTAGGQVRAAAAPSATPTATGESSSLSPASPPAATAAAPRPQTSARPADAGAAPDPITRVTRRARSARAARAPVAPDRMTPAPTPRPAGSRASIARTPAARDSVLRDPPASGRETGRGAQSSRPNDIVAYWTRLRGARRFPKSAELDAAAIGESWPNSILIRCRPGSRVLEPDKIFMAGQGSASGLSGLSAGGRINLSPMMLQWLLGLAGEVVREGRPMNDVETFPSVNRVVHYRAVALPFSDNENAVDHVLCHVKPEA